MLPGGRVAGKVACLAQIGELTLKQGARSHRFTEEQEPTIDRVAFTWCARFPMLGLDLVETGSYQPGEGLLEVRLGGLPLQLNRRPELAPDRPRDRCSCFGTPGTRSGSRRWSAAGSMRQPDLRGEQECCRSSASHYPV